MEREAVLQDRRPDPQRDPPQVVLRARGLRAGYGRGADVLRGIDLELRTGEAVAILGPSGEGKSTLLKALAGLVPPRAGRLDVCGAAGRRPPAGCVGYVPQRLGLVRHTSVLDNVQHGGLHETGWLQSLLHRAPRHIVQRSRDALAAVRLQGKEHEPIHRLSGGQQRRVAVARALVQRPRLLLADEFLGELDPRTAQTVADAVTGLRQRHGTAVLLVEHQAHQAHRIADRVYRLEDGRLHEETGEGLVEAVHAA